MKVKAKTTVAAVITVSILITAVPIAGCGSTSSPPGPTMETDTTDAGGMENDASDTPSTDIEQEIEPREDSSEENPAPSEDQPSTPAAGTVSLVEIISNPQSYQGKTFTTEGVFAGRCCASGFYIKQGVDRLRIWTYSTAPSPPQSKINSNVRVTGTVEIRGGEGTIVAREIEML